MNFVKSIVVILAFTLFFIACGETKTENKPVEKANTNVSTPANVKPSATIDEMAAARIIYKEKCVKCHKEDGTGGKVEIDGETLNSEDFTSDKMKKMDDEKYVKYITKGIQSEGMPAFEKILSEAEIKDVIKFIRSEFQK